MGARRLVKRLLFSHGGDGDGGLGQRGGSKYRSGHA